MRSLGVKVYVLGSFTIDEIGDELVVGGPAYYSSLALTHMDHSNITIVSPVSDIHRRLVKDLRVNVVSVGSRTPVFKLTYVDGGRRLVVLKSKGEEIRFSDDVLWLMKDSLVIVSPVFREIDLNLLLEVRRYASMIALDIQGFIRRLSDGGQVSIVWSDDVYKALRLADVIHADLSEVPGVGSMGEGCRLLNKYSDAIVMVSNGERGLVASINGSYYYVPALPGIEGNATGTGDILLAITAFEMFKGEDPLKAIAKGAVAAGLRVGRDRPPWFNGYEVEVLALKLLSKVKMLAP